MPRFTIRTATFIVAGVALLLCPVAWRVNVSKRQALAASSLVQLGAYVGYSHEWDQNLKRFTGNSPAPHRAIAWLLGEQFFAQADFVSFVEFRGGAAKLDVMVDLPYVRSVSFVNSEIPTGVLELFASLPQLEELNLSDTPLNDRQLDRISEISSLKYVNIMGTAVTAEAVLLFKKQRPDCAISSGLDPKYMNSLLRLMSMQALRI